jgi:hypothetical protein
MPTPCLRSSKGTRDWWPCSSPVAGTDVETVVRTARKITHYGRYGRLSFKDGVNIGKGVGEVSGSPLVVDLETRLMTMRFGVQTLLFLFLFMPGTVFRPRT